MHVSLLSVKVIYMYMYVSLAVGKGYKYMSVSLAVGKGYKYMYVSLAVSVRLEINVCKPCCR